MGDKSKIEWTDASWNPVRAVHKLNPARTGAAAVGWFCVHASEGCRNCYAEAINRRRGNGKPYKAQERADLDVFLHEETLTQPLRWKRPRMIFAGSMTDLFGDWVTDAMLDRIFAVMALCPQHTFQVLTKRAERMRAYFTHDDGFGRWGHIEHHARTLAKVPPGRTLATYGGGNLPNVWLGVSTEDQRAADLRIPDLLATPAAVRFVSAEPLLGPINLRDVCNGWSFRDFLTGARWHEPEDGPGYSDKTARLDWVIVGGESGPNARPMHPAWARFLRDQCAAAGVPFFFKQWGAFLHHDERDAEGYLCSNAWTGGGPEGDQGLHHWPDGTISIRLPKARAGRLLDGVERNAMPAAHRVGSSAQRPAPQGVLVSSDGG